MSRQMRVFGMSIGLMIVLVILGRWAGVYLGGSSTAGEAPAAAPQSGFGDSLASRTATPSAVASSAPDALPWTGVTDGEWLWGSSGIPLGQPAEHYSSAYAITVQGPPVLTTTDGGAHVTATATISVELAHEAFLATSGDRIEPIAKTESIVFMPGASGGARAEEDRSLAPSDISCDGQPAELGEKATCAISHTAPSGEIQDFYWQINTMMTAAWPGQTS